MWLFQKHRKTESLQSGARTTKTNSRESTKGKGVQMKRDTCSIMSENHGSCSNLPCSVCEDGGLQHGRNGPAMPARTRISVTLRHSPASLPWARTQGGRQCDGPASLCAEKLESTMKTDKNGRRRINKTIKQIQPRSTPSMRPPHTVLLE